MISLDYRSDFIRERPVLFQIIVPVVTGAVVAVVSAVLLGNASFVWTFLVIMGITVIVMSIYSMYILKDATVFWFALFLCMLPVNVQKNFADSNKILYELYSTGLPWGRNMFVLDISDLPLLVLFFIWFFRWMTKKEAFYWPSINYLPLAFLIWATFGLFFSNHPSFSFYELLMQYKLFFIYLFTINNINPKKMGKLIIVMLSLGLLLQSGVTVSKYIFQHEYGVFGNIFGESDDPFLQVGTISEDSDVQRGAGTFGHPNATAMYFQFVVPLVFVLMFTSLKLRGKLLNLLLVTAGFISVYVTFSRTGMISLLLAVGVCMVTLYFRKLVSRKLIALILCIGLLLTPVIIPAMFSHLTTRQDFAMERFSHWYVGTKMTSLNPFIGTGINTVTVMRSQIMEGRFQITDDNLPIHNHYLIGLIETGIIGTFLYVGFFIMVGIEAFRRSKSRDFITHTLAIAILGTYSALALYMTVDFMTAGALFVLLWFYAGLIIAFKRDERRNHKKMEVQPR